MGNEDEASEPARKAGRRVIIHVGAPKTGTTFLQGVLWRNRQALRAAGLHIVGQSRGDHYRAGHDIRGVEYNPKDPRPDWAGSWDVLAALAVGSQARTTVISDEHLASLTPEQVQRAVSSLKGREVHVVYTTRNLARLLPSEHQEYVKHRSPLTYEEWATRVFNERDRGPGKWFWSVHSPVDVVNRWSTAVEAKNIHVLTLPMPGAPKDELWHRFCVVADVDPGLATDFEVLGNDSLGLAETEVLRRVNKALPKTFPRWHHSGLARDVLATRILGPRSKSGRPPVPEPIREAVLLQTEANVEGLGSGMCDLVGNLEELSVTDDLASGLKPPTDAELLDAAVEGISGLLVQMGRMRDDRRRAEGGLRRQLTASGQVARTRTRVASMVDRTRLGSAALSRYRNARERSNHP
ncbi:MAG: hypothetical protein LH645_01260 [Actinomycetia bacterium]|nr:hypothetical protein [Actinomycetes bacterium]